MKGVKKMKSLKLITAVLITAGLVIEASLAYAGSSDSLTVKVTVTPSISVNITETELLLGNIAAGATKVSTAAVTVTNNGSGVAETYSLSLVNPPGWTASQTATGAEVYVLNAAFSSAVSGIAWDNAKHAIPTTPDVCTPVRFAGDQTGAAVPYNAVRKLWFQFNAPTSTAVATEQGIVVTITAQAS